MFWVTGSGLRVTGRGMGRGMEEWIGGGVEEWGNGGVDGWNKARGSRAALALPRLSASNRLPIQPSSLPIIRPSSRLAPGLRARPLSVRKEKVEQVGKKTCVASPRCNFRQESLLRGFLAS